MLRFLHKIGFLLLVILAALLAAILVYAVAAPIAGNMHSDCQVADPVNC